jgi:hypothetical protein
VRYDVRVADGTRFEHEQDKPLKPGDFISPPGMSYQVTSIRELEPAESDEFDAIAEVEWRAGPVQAGRQH